MRDLDPQFRHSSSRSNRKSGDGEKGKENSKICYLGGERGLLLLFRGGGGTKHQKEKGRRRGGMPCVCVRSCLNFRRPTDHPPHSPRGTAITNKDIEKKSGGGGGGATAVKMYEGL